MLRLHLSRRSVVVHVLDNGQDGNIGMHAEVGIMLSTFFEKNPLDSSAYCKLSFYQVWHHGNSINVYSCEELRVNRICYLLHVGFLPGLFILRDDGGYIFCRNVG
jgi:hypothetical protein